MKKTLLSIKTGAYGDLFVCAPIAKFYSDIGYQVFWPVQPRFLSIIQKFNYVTSDITMISFNSFNIAIFSEILLF